MSILSLSQTFRTPPTWGGGVRDIPAKFPGHPRFPPSNQRDTHFRGREKLFDPHPFAQKTPTLPCSLRTQKVNICAPSSGKNRTCENRTCEIDRAHFLVHFCVHCQISREHCRGSLRGNPVECFTQSSSTFVGISVGIFVYTPVCIFLSTFVREFVGQMLQFACAVLF